MTALVSDTVIAGALSKPIGPMYSGLPSRSAFQSTIS